MAKQKARLSLEEGQELELLKEAETLLNEAADFYNKGDFTNCARLYIKKTNQAEISKEQIIKGIIEYGNQGKVADMETMVQKRIKELEANSSYEEYVTNFLTKIFPGKFGKDFISSVMKQKQENANAQQKIKLTEDGYREYQEHINSQKIHDLQVFFEGSRAKDSEGTAPLGDAHDE